MWGRRSGFNIPIVEYLVDQWRRVLRVEVNAQVLTFPAFRTRLLSSPPDIRLAIWGPDYPDPDCFLGQIGPLDLWHDPQYEQLITSARAEMNHGQRMALYHMAHQLLLAEAAIIPLTYPAGQYLCKPWFRYGYGGRTGRISSCCRIDFTDLASVIGQLSHPAGVARSNQESDCSRDRS